MKLEKTLHSAIVGQSYLSLLLSLNLLKQSHKVLLVDDERFQLGTVLTSYITVLEKRFLEQMGHRFSVEALVHLDRYLIPQKITFVQEGKRLRLGMDPWSNLQELARKFFSFLNHSTMVMGDVTILRDKLSSLDKEQFNNMFDQVVYRLMKHIEDVEEGATLSLEDLFLEDQDFLKQLFSFFCHFIRTFDAVEMELKDIQAMAFLYSSTGFYQNCLAIGGRDIELLHLFLSLLSPLYKLDEKQLIDDLQRSFVDLGGYLKKTKVNEWFFDKGAPWAMELHSYEGIVHPERILFFVSSMDGLPFEVVPSCQCYQSLDMQFVAPSEDFLDANEIYVITSKDHVGSYYPLWLLSKENNQYHTKTFFQHQKVNKVEFEIKDIQLYLKKELLKQFFIKLETFQDLTYSLGSDIISLRENRRLSKAEENFLHRSKPQVFQVADDGHRLFLRDVFYFGPLGKKNLGLFSLLSDLNYFEQDDR